MKKWIPLISINLGTFMLLIDTTVVNVALSHIGTSLQASFSSLQWVIDGYAVTLAALLLGVGSLADLLGQRRVYLGGLILFAAASAACGAAPNDTVLVLARVVQGIGGAALFATTTALINATYQGRDRGTAFGSWAAVSSAAAAVGPILGGVLVQGFTWRWIFYINLPICLIAIVLTLRYLKPDRDRPDRGRPGRRVDLAGIVTFTLAAASLTYALTTHAYLLLGGSAVALIAFLAIETRSDHALLDLSLFRHGSFNGVMAAALVVNFVAFGPLTYTAIWLQGVEGLSPIGVGLSIVPVAAAAFVVSSRIGRSLDHLPPGPVIAAGLGFVAAGAFVTMVLLHGGAGWPALMAGFTLTGIGTGLATPTFTSAAMGSVPPERGGMASGAITTARQLGFAIGIAVLGTVFARSARTSLGSSDIAEALTSGRAQDLIARDATLTEPLHQASLSGLDSVFLVTGLVSAVAALTVLALFTRPFVRPSEALHERR